MNKIIIDNGNFGGAKDEPARISISNISVLIGLFDYYEAKYNKPQFFVTKEVFAAYRGCNQTSLNFIYPAIQISEDENIYVIIEEDDTSLFIVTCDSCDERVKVFSRPGKYHCPHCDSLIKLTKQDGEII